jgi:VanZ family protein
MIGKSIFFIVRNRNLVTALLIIATIVILALTMLPSNKLGDYKVYEYDKLGHFGLFFIWTFIFGLFNFSRKNFHVRLLTVFLAGSVFGIFIEIFQGALPYGRSASIYDALASIAGSFTATILLFWIKQRYMVKYREMFKK